MIKISKVAAQFNTSKRFTDQAGMILKKKLVFCLWENENMRSDKSWGAKLYIAKPSNIAVICTKNQRNNVELRIDRIEVYTTISKEPRIEKKSQVRNKSTYKLFENNLTGNITRLNGLIYRERNSSVNEKRRTNKETTKTSEITEEWKNTETPWNEKTKKFNRRRKWR